MFKRIQHTHEGGTEYSVQGTEGEGRLCRKGIRHAQRGTRKVLLPRPRPTLTPRIYGRRALATIHDSLAALGGAECHNIRSTEVRYRDSIKSLCAQVLEFSRHRRDRLAFFTFGQIPGLQASACTSRAGLQLVKVAINELFSPPPRAIKQMAIPLYARMAAWLGGRVWAAWWSSLPWPVSRLLSLPSLACSLRGSWGANLLRIICTP